MSEESIEVVIVNELGLHARAATQLVQLAAGYDSELFVSKGGREVNGKSIMGVLMLTAARGSRLGLRAVGPDAVELLRAIEELIANRFGEAQ
ncbi:MAG: HPr family phosphocarrier protein [Polyangia bacterium]